LDYSVIQAPIEVKVFLLDGLMRLLVFMCEPGPTIAQTPTMPPVNDVAWEITWQSPCAFRIRSENQSELVSMAQQHVKSIHNMELSREEILKTAKAV